MSSKKFKILKDGKIIESPILGKYAGHKRLKIFGRLDCWSGKRMKKSNRVFFHTLEDAIIQGFRPCKNCRPLDEQIFEKMKNLTGHTDLEDFYNFNKKKRRLRTSNE
ncbi:MAG: Ada metal-binding domain-containing protein [Candidatus Hodarchaeota archaeon]